MTVTLGIDVGSGAIKVALFDIEGDKIEPEQPLSEDPRRRWWSFRR